MSDPERDSPMDPNKRWTESLSAIAAAQEAHSDLLSELANSDSAYKALVTGRVHRKYGIFQSPSNYSPHEAVVELEDTVVEEFLLYPDGADASSDTDPELVAGFSYYVDTPGGPNHMMLYLTADDLASLEWRFAIEEPVDT